MLLTSSALPINEETYDENESLCGPDGLVLSCRSVFRSWYKGAHGQPRPSPMSRDTVPVTAGCHPFDAAAFTTTITPGPRGTAM